MDKNQDGVIDFNEFHNAFEDTFKSSHGGRDYRKYDQDQSKSAIFKNLTQKTIFRAKRFWLRGKLTTPPLNLKTS